VYKEVFQNILIEEENARIKDPEKCETVPSYLESIGFGEAKEPLVNIREFYNYWGSFISCKSFAWADLYKHEKEHNRYVRRMIDQENKKMRKKVKKKYMDKIK